HLSLLALALGLAPLFAQQQQPPPQAPPHTHLKVGDVAPDFTLPDNTNHPVKLSDFRGKKNVVLAFYPAAFTGGCTKEMQAYQFGLDKFEGADTQVFGVRTDNSPSQKRFAEDVQVVFPMLSDFSTRNVCKGS